VHLTTSAPSINATTKEAREAYAELSIKLYRAAGKSLESEAHSVSCFLAPSWHIARKAQSVVLILTTV